MSNAHRLILLLLSLATGAAGFFAYRTHGQLAHAQQRIATLEQERAAQRDRLIDLEKQLKTQPPAPSLALGPTDKTRSTSAQENIRQIMEMRAAAGQQPAPPSLLPVDNAETQRLIALQQRSALDFRYAALFRQLRLNPTQLEQLKNLLVERQSASADVHAAVRNQGINPRDGREVIRELVVDAQSETDTKILTALGDDVFTRFKTYEATFLERGIVNQLEQRLSYSASPLNTDQAERLVALLAETAAATPADGTGSPSGSDILAAYNGRNRAPQITTDALSRSSGLLDATQLAALRELQQEQAARAQLSRSSRHPVTPVRPPPAANSPAK